MKKEIVGILVAAGVLAVAAKAQTVVLTSDPPGATIFLRGGVEVGETPAITAITIWDADGDHVPLGFVRAGKGDGNSGKGANCCAPL
jgi:hypothetical protein